MSTPTKTPTVHWFFYSIAYSAISFLACLLLKSPAIFPLLVVTSIAIATIILSAIWSVYGTGNALERYVVSLVFTFIVALGIVFGIPKEAQAGGLAILPAVPAFCCAAQAVHWFFRIAFGWQFVVGKDRPSATTFNLRDLFFITLLVAVSIVGIRIAATLFVNANPLLAPAISFDPDQPAPSVEDRISLEQRNKEARKSVEQLISMQFGMYAVGIAVVSLLMTLTLLIVCGPKDLASGITWFAVAAGSYVAVWAGIYTGFGLGLFSEVNLFFQLFALTSIAFMVPLIHTRALGISLKLGRQRTQA